jgi:fructose-specific component phosphotransferase system IIB-like protein
VSLAITIQSRNVRDFSTSLDQASRLRREDITTDNRSRALSQVLEETLVNTKQVLGIQPWIQGAGTAFLNPDQRIRSNLAK